MFGPLRNPRHDEFASLVAGGMKARQAYAAAGFAGKGAAQSASRLAGKSDVAARIAELCSRASSASVARVALSREWVLSGLMKLADGAESESTRVRALELCGRELGMFRDPAENTLQFTDPRKMTDDQLRAWIAWLAPRRAAQPLTIEASAEPGPV
jgi:Terminase small subunit